MLSKPIDEKTAIAAVIDLYSQLARISEQLSALDEQRIPLESRLAQLDAEIDGLRDDRMDIIRRVTDISAAVR